MKDKLFREMTDEEFLKLMKKVVPRQIAEDIVSVQPMDDVNAKELSEDPFINATLSNMVNRTINK